MKIASANLQMASSHASLQHHEVKESLKMWVGQRRPDFAGEANQGRPPLADSVSISDAGKAAQSADSIKEAQDAAVDSDPGLNLIRSMLEFMTGRKIRIFDASQLQARMDKTSTEASQAAINNPPPRPAMALNTNTMSLTPRLSKPAFRQVARSKQPMARRSVSSSNSR